MTLNKSSSHATARITWGKNIYTLKRQSQPIIIIPSIQQYEKIVTRCIAAMTSSPYRPILHVTDTTWINDPCAPGYDPATGLYHIFYQCMRSLPVYRKAAIANS